jgi:hypothetical protein
LICQICQATGWSWDYVEDQLTVRRLRALARHWRVAPPPHLLLQCIAQALGWRPAAMPDAAGPAGRPEGWNDLLELAGDPRSGIAVRGKPPS